MAVYHIVLVILCCLTAVQSSPKITGVGRSEATPGEFPYLAVILEKASQELVTVGVLVRQNVVLTIGWNYYVLKEYNPSELVVLLGAHNRSIEERSQQRIDVAEILVHPELIETSEGEGTGDLALIRLSSKAKITRRVEVFPLKSIASKSKLDNRLPRSGDCVTAGYGHIKYNEYEVILPTTLQKYSPQMKRKKECNQFIQQKYNSTYDETKWVCSLNDDMTGSRYYDGGNPLFCSLNGGVVRLHGLVAIIDDDYDLVGFNAYTRLSEFNKWIVTKAKALSLKN